MNKHTLTLLSSLFVSSALYAQGTKAPEPGQIKRTQVQRGTGLTVVKPGVNRVYGTVIHDGVKGSVVTIGMPGLGRVVVETQGAKIRTKTGKAATLRSLTPGSNITALGSRVGSTFKAKEVIVNYIRPLGKTKPVTITTKKVTKTSGSKRVSG